MFFKSEVDDLYEHELEMAERYTCHCDVCDEWQKHATPELPSCGWRRNGLVEQCPYYQEWLVFCRSAEVVGD